jgi:polyisoprenoid-binding protein YceI
MEPVMATTNTDGAPSPSGLAASIEGARGRWTLDPLGSRAEFHVKHFWGAVTVHGSLDRISGEGTVGPGGSVAGRLVIDASSLSTHNRQRDKHLRSADFFDVEHHPEVVVTVHRAEPLAGAALLCQGTLEAAGHEEPLEFTANVEGMTADAVTRHAEVVLDRTRFGMTWSPLRIAARQAQLVATARFVRP